VIFDSATLVSFFDRDDSNHWAVTGTIELLAGVEPLVVSPFVIAELEPIVIARYGAEGWRATLDELASGAWTIALVDPGHLARVAERCGGGASLAAASSEVLVERDSS
jgi:hypothetical protein